MILNCPSCSAKFMVSAEAFGYAGRTVKCGKCGHSWFQEAVRDSLDDLQKLVDNIQGADTNASADAPQEHTEQDLPRAAESSGQEIKLERSPREHAKAAKEKQNTSKTDKSYLPIWWQKYERDLAAFMMALAIIAVIVWGVVSLSRVMLAPEPSQFMIDQIKFEMSENKLDGTFRVINLSENEQNLPEFKVFLMAPQNRIVSTSLIKPNDQNTVVKGEDTITVPFSFRAPPSVANEIKVISVP